MTRKGDEVSLAFTDDTWVLEDVFMMIEGGNGKFTTYMSQYHKDVLFDGDDPNSKQEFLKGIDARYSTKAVQTYAKVLLKCTKKVLDKHGLQSTRR